MWRCTWSTTASLKKPRATPDWLVTITTQHPRAIQRADGVDGPRVQIDALHAIEVAHLFDQRAVAIQKHGAGLP